VDERPIAAGSPGELESYCRRGIDACRELRDAILRAGPSRSRSNTLDPLNRLHLTLGAVTNTVGLLRQVHPDPAIRAAAEKAEQEVARFSSELDLDAGLYEAVRSSPTAGLDAAGKRSVEHLLRDFRRAGVDRDEPTRARIRALKEELVDLKQRFTRNIREDVKTVRLESVAELAGLPDDYISDHPPGGDGTIAITTDYPDYNPFMAYAQSGARRRQLYTEFRRRGYPKNLEVLAAILARRHELARLLGHSSWAAYIAEDKMIKTPAAIAAFIERVSELADASARRDYDALLARKLRVDPAAVEVHDWEKTYYQEEVKREEFRVDSKEVRPYFEYGRVKDGILALTEELFGLSFAPAPGAPRWHEDVEVLDVLEGGRMAGRIYLDMHPRAGKFKHAAVFPMTAGVRGSEPPEAAIICNFPDPRRERQGPALLEHDDVLTLFHEFGHLLHHLLARDSEWCIQSGIATEWDFVEVPSQLYEEWAWDPAVLRRFAVHHETGEPIPAELVGRMRKAGAFGRALWAGHQAFYAALSLACYDRDPAGIDTSALTRALQNRYSAFRFVEGTFFQASFGHLDDYSALYYTYLWSLVIAKDMFDEFRKEGALGRETARRYRERVLAPGGSKDAADLVRDFLGRDYTFDAFEGWLGG
jgi:thimet oligopeptidase